MNTFEPRHVDLSTRLQGGFGCVEFEDAIIEIVKYLADDSRNAGIGEWCHGNGPNGWGKKLRIDTIPAVSPTMFAMLCGAGWLENCWFPKGAFVVTKALIERLEKKFAAGEMRSQAVTEGKLNEIITTPSSETKAAPRTSEVFAERKPRAGLPAGKIPPANIVRETKVGSKIRICHDALRGDWQRAPHILDGPYIGSNELTVARFLFEHGKWWAVTEGGGYFKSWILVR
jgi:hypothetical protein